MCKTNHLPSFILFSPVDHCLSLSLLSPLSLKKQPFPIFNTVKHTGCCHLFVCDLISNNPFRQDPGQTAFPQHFLYFFPEPQGQGSFRPTLASFRRTVCCFWPSPSPPTCPLPRDIFCSFRRGRSSSCAGWMRYRVLTVSSRTRPIISSNMLNPSILYSLRGSLWP